MPQPTLSDLKAFVAVTKHGSFRRAADDLGLSPSSLSHTLRTLERHLGIRLLNRTTRSVSPTAVGEHLLDRLQPVLRDLNRALEELDDLRDKPSGTVRINAPDVAARLLLRHVVPIFLARHPTMAVDLVTEGRLIDIVAEGFDAGVRLGETLPKDMIAVHFDGPARFLAVAAPAYLAGAGTPETPDDLRQHRCIRNRLPSGKLFRWEFERHGQDVTLDVPGVLTLDRIDFMLDAACGALGIAYVPERAARPYLSDGRLVTVLADWCPPISGLFLYYPGHRHVPAGLRMFIDTLKEILP